MKRIYPLALLVATGDWTPIPLSAMRESVAVRCDGLIGRDYGEFPSLPLLLIPIKSSLSDHRAAYKFSRPSPNPATTPGKGAVEGKGAGRSEDIGVGMSG